MVAYCFDTIVNQAEESIVFISGVQTVFARQLLSARTYMKDINMTLNTKGDPTQSAPVPTSVKQPPSSAHGFMIRDILDNGNQINSEKPADQGIFADNSLQLISGLTAANLPTGGGAREYLDRQGTTLTMPTLKTAANYNDSRQQGAPAGGRSRSESESVPVKHGRKSSCAYPSHPSSKPPAAPLPPADDSDQETSTTDHDSTGKKQRKPRTAFSDFQLQALEKSFDRQKYLSVQERMELAAKLNLADAQVKCWFQNRRTKWKRQHSLQFDSAEFYPALHRMLLPGVGGLPFAPIHSSWPFAASLPSTPFHGTALSLPGYPAVSHNALPTSTPSSTSPTDANLSSPFHRHLGQLTAPGSNSFSGQRYFSAAGHSQNVYLSQPSLSHGFL